MLVKYPLISNHNSIFLKLDCITGGGGGGGGGGGDKPIYLGSFYFELAVKQTGPPGGSNFLGVF